MIQAERYGRFQRVLVFALSLQQWSYIAEIVAGLGVAFVAFQVLLGVRNSRVELVTGMTTLITQVDQAFIDYPEMRKYFGDATPVKKSKKKGSGKSKHAKSDDRDEYERARAVAMTLANVLDHAVEHQRKMKLRTRYAWRVYIADVHENSSVLRELLQAHPNWWPGLQTQIGRGRPKAPGYIQRLFFR